MFGATLRKRRERVGWSLEKLAGEVMSSKSVLARIEAAEAVIPVDLPDRLDVVFGTDDLFAVLYELAKTEIHPDRYRRRMALEAQAVVIDEYAGQIIPGLVQTEDYARALFRVSNPRQSAEAIEEMVAVRMGRQQLLRADQAPYLSIILDEAALRRSIGGAAVMRVQLALLLQLVDGPTTVVQVVPFSHGEHALLGGSMTLFTLDDGSAVGYEESIVTGTLIEDPELVASRRRAYDLLRAHALSPQATSVLISDVMEALPE